MSSDRAQIVHQNFLNKVKKNDLPSLSDYDISSSGLSKDTAIQIFESQILSRHLDLQSRKLQAQGEGFYT